MRTAAAALVAAAVAGCSDPVVDVEVRLPDGRAEYRDLRAVSISVLATEEFDCDAVAFGLIDDDAIALAEATGATFTESATGAIAGVPRGGAKLWVAEGLDADGARRVAGCTAQGTIDDDTTVVIETEPVADLVVAGHLADEPVPDTIAVRVDDGLDVPEPLADREVRWEVYGPAGGHETGAAASTDEDGRASLAIQAPEGYGPQSLQLRARWASTQPVVVPGFRGRRGDTRLIAGACPPGTSVDTEDWQPARIGARRALAGLARDGSRARLYVAAWDGAASVHGCSGDDLPPVASFAVLRDAGDGERLVAITATEWRSYTLAADAGAVTVAAEPPQAWTNPGGQEPIAVAALRACRESGELDAVLAELPGGTVVAFHRDGSAWPGHMIAAGLSEALPQLAGDGPIPTLVDTGCISQGPGTQPLQAALVEVVRDTGEPSALRLRWLLIATPEGGVALPVPSFGAVAFSPVSLAEPFLLGGTLDPSGAKVVRWRLTPVGDGVELREEVRDDAIGPPASIALGDLDGDAALDTVWGLVDALPGGLAEARLQMSFGCGAGELALNGLSAQIGTGAAAVFLAPEPDGTSDLLVGGAQSAIFIDTDALP